MGFGPFGCSPGRFRSGGPAQVFRARPRVAALCAPECAPSHRLHLKPTTYELKPQRNISNEVKIVAMSARKNLFNTRGIQISLNCTLSHFARNQFVKFNILRICFSMPKAVVWKAPVAFRLACLGDREPAMCVSSEFQPLTVKRDGDKWLATSPSIF